MPLPHSCGIMLLAKQYETNLSQCGIITDLSMRCSQALAASLPSYLYSGIIATHFRSQALAVYLPSYDMVLAPLRSQALAAHSPPYLYSGMMPLSHSCGMMLHAKQCDTIQGHCGIIAVLSIIVASSPAYIRAHRHLRHYCRLFIMLLLGKQCETITRSFLRLHCRLLSVLTGTCDIIVVCVMLLLGKQCETITRPFLRLHRRPSFAFTGACDFIVVLLHHCPRSLRHSCRLLICAYVPLSRLSPNNVERTLLLYRFVVDYARSFTYIMSTPVFLILFTSLLLGIRSLKP
jgi:hypothetical protein